MGLLSTSASRNIQLRYKLNLLLARNHRNKTTSTALPGTHPYPTVDKSSHKLPNAAVGNKGGGGAGVAIF